MIYKRLTIMFSALLILFSIHVFGNENTIRVTMYAPDGRTIIIAENAVEEYEKVGWFTEPPVPMYSEDGRTKYVIPSRVEAEKSVGWFTDKNDVTIVMYTEDGRTMRVFKGQVEDYKKVGWFTSIDEVTITMYADDGRTKSVFKADVQNQKNQGWHESLSEVLTTMYSEDGRTKSVYKASVPEHKKQGWYETKAEVVITMYAPDGRSKEVFKANIAAETKVGWYTEPVIYMYSADGRRILIKKSMVKAYTLVGWYENEDDTYQYIYSLSSQKRVLRARVNDWVKVGWSTKAYPVELNASFANNSQKNSCIDLIVNIRNTASNYKAISAVEFDACYFDEAGNPLCDLYGINYRHIKYDCPPLNWYSSGYVRTNFFANVSNCFKILIKNIKVTYIDGSSEQINSFVYAYKTQG